MRSSTNHAAFWYLLLSGAGVCVSANWATASDKPFQGEKSTWHGNFDRFDYLMDETTLEIVPFKRPDGEAFAIKDPPKGKRRCVIIAPPSSANSSPSATSFAPCMPGLMPAPPLHFQLV